MPEFDSENSDTFSFNISLSILNHLGRNLYRSFVTVLGEAISNAWDADAKNVNITIDRDSNFFVIEDDGNGMLPNDFQTKFLKVGYSKREQEGSHSKQGRPFIGRKGIGKLALLSCARKIHIATKTQESSEASGGVIDNSKLDEKIEEDSIAYELEKSSSVKFQEYRNNLKKGTLFYFEDVNDGIKNRVEYLKTVIALYFRFSMVDEDFKIFINDEEITHKHLQKLATNTQFLWKINSPKDPYVSEQLSDLKETTTIDPKLSGCFGFIATVELPRHLKVFASEEKVGLDLFVNGRLREKNILRHMPAYSTRHVASYIYGQIHYNDLDDDKDRFTSSRESVISDDDKYQKLIKQLKDNVLSEISEKWDIWRRKHKEDGDPENTTVITKQERKAGELVNETMKVLTPPKTSKNKDKVKDWMNDLYPEAQFNVSSYTECFISENLLRIFIQDQNISLTSEAEGEVKKWKTREQVAKDKGNISIEVMQHQDDLNYLSMDDLTAILDKKGEKFASLFRDAKEYKPMRNAVAHTAKLTPKAKQRLNSVYENIQARLRNLLSGQ